MKKYLFAVLSVFILQNVFLNSFALSQENISFEALTQNSSKDESVNPFTLTVSENDSLLVKPGKVFSQGHDAGMALPYLVKSAKSIQYPRWAVRQGWEGELIMALEILENGSVGRVVVIKSTGHKALDQAAQSAIKDWKFHPAVENGKPVVCCIQIPVVFQLKDK